jgi:YaiO family outer membrane protein
MKPLRLGTQIFLIFLLPALSLLVYAGNQQSQGRSLNSDELFARARTLAHKGKRQEARDICTAILEQKPGYHGVRVLLGRLYLWDEDYDQARREFLRVLEEKPDFHGARNAMIDAEYWSDHYQSALIHCNKGLAFSPDYEDFLLKKTRILIKMEDYKQASDTVHRLININPAHEDALRLLESIKYSTELFRISQRYRFDGLKRDGGDFRPWHLAALELSTKTSLGTLIGRVNYGSCTYGSEAKNGTQFEVDVYPKFKEGLYAYLNVGYSSDSIFPQYRFGSELYMSLPFSFEFSAGIRYLDFSSSNVLIYTGSVGKYYKNYWFSLRPFIISKSTGLSISSLLLIRKYIRSRDNYLGFLFGFGSSPVEIFYLEDIERVNSFKLGLEVMRELSRSIVIMCFARFEREEYVRNKFGNRITISLRLEERIFKKYK